ncbi:NAD(P)/FAD-dependent oxidoreductase [Dongia sp.]|uniref:NAD(P)/FAD-dependent oxidoreductase n=1 Tax=Dongia sp. TaxID=1977262 RepID=UPI0035ADE911
MNMSRQSVSSRSADTRLPASLWAATACPAPDYARLREDMICDTAIVGGGFTGLSTALHLALRGQRVIVAEAAEPGWGAAGRNGGQVIAGLKTDPLALIGLFGADLGARMAGTMGKAADLVFDLIQGYGMDCHARRGGWLQAAHGPKPYRDLIQPRYRQWRDLGVDCDLLSAAEIGALIGSAPTAYVGGWLDRRGGTLQPLSYARGLAAAAMREGATILARTPVHRLRRDEKGWELQADPYKISARRLVLATNAYTGMHGDKLIPGIERSIVPVASFQMATPPLPAKYDGILPEGLGVTDSRRLLLYFRRDHTGRLVMGGRSPVDDRPDKADAVSLRRAVTRIFPQIEVGEVDFVWSGKVAISKDKLPHIHMPEVGLISFMGCNGRGVAVCTMMGRILADLASGAAAAEVPFPITAPDHFRLHGLRKAGVFALSKYYSLLDRLESLQRG